MAPSLRIAVAHPLPAVRTWLVSTLRTDGYDVAAVSSGEQLVTRLASWMLAGRRADLVITAQRLGPLSGLEIAMGIRGSDWDAPVILVVDADEPPAPGHVAGAVLAWPFEADVLRRAVADRIRGR